MFKVKAKITLGSIKETKKSRIQLEKADPSEGLIQVDPKGGICKTYMSTIPYIYKDYNILPLAVS